MGCFGSKDRLSKEDMDFLKTHTRYDETTIKEWYKGFKVSQQCLLTNMTNIFFYVIKFSHFSNNKNAARLSEWETNTS